MSMLELDVKLPELDGLVKDLGLEEGGRAQQHLVKNVARRITKYVPKRTYSSIENAIAQGQEPANGRIVIRGPQVKYLYFGKVMAGRKPKHVTNNRRWWIDLSANDSPQWAEVSVGITSRGNSINEQSQEYYDMAGRGVAESEVTGVSVSRTFTGFRRFGDAAQDAIMDRLYDLDNRKVKFIECYDNLGSGKPNGRQGEGVLSITDDGSGDAQNRENISFGLKILGTPQKGTVTIGEDGTPTFSPQAAEAKAASK